MINQAIVNELEKKIRKFISNRGISVAFMFILAEQNGEVTAQSTDGTDWRSILSFILENLKEKDQ